ncbi:MAG: hypothetical protein Q7S28_02495 [bacterium]|nr:hypothetical protein [bacterium]
MIIDVHAHISKALRFARNSFSKNLEELLYKNAAKVFNLKI